MLNFAPKLKRINVKKGKNSGISRYLGNAKKSPEVNIGAGALKQQGDLQKEEQHTNARDLSDHLTSPRSQAATGAEAETAAASGVREDA